MSGYDKRAAPAPAACKRCGKTHQNVGVGGPDYCQECNGDHAFNAGPVCDCVDDVIEQDMWKILTKYAHAKENPSPEGYTSVSWEDLMREFSLSERYCYALLTILDNEGLIEHGTSIRYSSITPHGELMAKMPPPE